jgi:hypothetical protein
MDRLGKRAWDKKAPHFGKEGLKKRPRLRSGRDDGSAAWTPYSFRFLPLSPLTQRFSSKAASGRLTNSGLQKMERKRSM